MHVVMLLTGSDAVCTDSGMKYINRRCGQNAEFLGAFTKLRKETVSSVLFICSSACTRHPMDKLSWNFIFEYVSKISWKFTFHENMTIIIGTLQEDQCIFMTVPRWILHRMRNVSDKVVEKIEKHILLSVTFFFFRKSYRLWENVKKKKLAASSMLHEAKIAYYAFDVIVYCMYTHQTRIAYTKRTHWIAYTKRIRRHIVCN